MYHIFDSIYSSLFTQDHKTDKKLLKKLNCKNRDELIQHYLDTLVQTNDVYGLMSLLTYRKYHDEGCNSLFIESNDDLAFLLKLKFDYSRLDAREHIKFTTNCFSVALPKGVKLNGCNQALNGFMVLIGNKEDFTDLCEDVGRLYHQGDCMIKVFYRGQDGCEVVVSLGFEQIPLLISSETADDFDQALGKKCITASLTRFERLQQFIYLKLVLSLALYEQAMPEEFVDGFPSKLKICHLPKSRNFTHYSARKLSITNAQHHSKPCVVPAFLRQLNHYKYYQNEHANKPVGSRWVLVKLHTRNQQINPRTVHAEQGL